MDLARASASRLTDCKEGEQVKETPVFTFPSTETPLIRPVANCLLKWK
jgi:hypothetical protein